MSETPDPAAPAVAPTPAPDPSPSPPTTPLQAANSRLDAILVTGVLLIVAGILLGLFVVNDIKVTLPTIASFGSALISAVIAGYAGYRWGASDAMKKQGGVQ